MSENSVVYSPLCCWWDDISKASKLLNDAGRSRPCCPHCGGVLSRITESEWWASVNLYEQDHPGYRRFVEWRRGKCFSTYKAVQEAYKADHPMLDLDVLKWLDSE